MRIEKAKQGLCSNQPSIPVCNSGILIICKDGKEFGFSCPCYNGSKCKNIIESAKTEKTPLPLDIRKPEWKYREIHCGCIRPPYPCNRVCTNTCGYWREESKFNLTDINDHITTIKANAIPSDKNGMILMPINKRMEE